MEVRGRSKRDALFNACRLCLSVQKDMKPLNNNLVSILEKFIKNKITLSFGSNKICKRCCDRLFEVSAFYSACLESFYFWTSYMKNKSFVPDTTSVKELFATLGSISNPGPSAPVTIVDSDVSDEVNIKTELDDSLRIEIVDDENDDSDRGAFQDPFASLDNYCDDVSDDENAMSVEDAQTVKIRNVSSAWVNENILCWPRITKKSSLEAERSKVKAAEGPTQRIECTANSATVMNVETIAQDNSFLKARVRWLNKQIEYHQNQDKNFSIIQAKLDKLLELGGHTVHTDIQNDCSIRDDEILITGVTFPIETMVELETLEAKLSDKEVEAYMITRFSKIGKTGSTMTLAKIAFILIKRLIADEVLYQCAWKGIKGTTKVAFTRFKRFRDIFFKILNLADGTCTVCDADNFLQHKAIKHSGQRLKRKSSTEDWQTSIKNSKSGPSISAEDVILECEIIPENSFYTK